MGNFVYYVWRALDSAIYVYSLLLVVYALMSWLPGARDSKLGEWVEKLVRPYLEIFDRVIPSIGGIGFSVMAGVIFLQLVQRGLYILFVRIMMMIH
ncbi:MAG: YggT family protein [Bavariicoccus seileri]|nr:YggT family protein [Bavariicoccus seileri]